MKRTIRKRPKADKESDPRKARDFNPDWYPKADGGAPPACDASERQDRIRLQFLAVYYQLNQSYADLLAVRGKRQRGATDRKANEPAALRKIEKLLCERDALEDEFAAYGIIAEPVLKKGFTIDVKFHFGTAPPRANDLQGMFYSSTFITIPLPSGVKLE